MASSIAGIGSRKISAEVSKNIFTLGFLFASSGFTIRSGGAPGADTSFEMGAVAYHDLKQRYPDLPGELASDYLQIFLPSYRFSNRVADEVVYFHKATRPLSKKAQDMASSVHPNWPRLSEFARLLMARNSHQIYGLELNDPVEKVVCYTPDGATNIITSKTGGTGQALRLANIHGLEAGQEIPAEANPDRIPIDNLGDPETMKRYQARINANIERFKPWVDISTLYEKTCKDHAPGFLLEEADLLSDKALSSTDVLIHGTNCQHKMKSGFALQLVKKFPEVVPSDFATPKGSGKLGTYSSVKVQHNGRDLIIVNAYTQVSPASYKQQQDESLVVDYEAVRKVMNSISKDFPGKNFSMPKIGSGLENGCWLSLGHIIGGSFHGKSLSVYDSPSNRPSMKKAPNPESQRGFGF
jgi:hypothetical protein